MNGNGASSMREALEEVLVSGRLDLPHPGEGSTAERLRALMDLARTRPVGVARLAEAHCDAVSILHEADRKPVPGTVYGVWASGHADDLRLEGSTVTGVKRFCSGLGIVERALVTVTDTAGAERLVDVAVDPDDGVAFDTTGWATAALSDTATGDVRFDAHEIDSDRVVGTPGWYLDRPGFWHGACGPAACWAGGTLGLIDVAHRLRDADPHRGAQTGALEAAAWGLEALFDAAGREIDASPDDRLAALWNYFIFRVQSRMFRRQDLKVRRNTGGFLFYVLGYSVIMQPVCVWGYAAELLGWRKRWDTK